MILISANTDKMAWSGYNNDLSNQNLPYLIAPLIEFANADNKNRIDPAPTPRLSSEPKEKKKRAAPPPTKNKQNSSQIRKKQSPKSKELADDITINNFI